MSVIVKLLSKFDDSGIKKAKSSFGGLGKALGAVGIGIGISQITDLLMDSAKAASADAKSTQLLNTQLQKNAHATKTQIANAGKFIEKLSLQTGIMDDDLRPSFARLARATGNTQKAQDLLTLSLDAATVAGKPLDTVSQAMAKAFTGNTKSLIRLFPELAKSKNLFHDLAKEVGGAAIQQADPFKKFNNSMDILKEKLGNAILPLISDFVDYLSKPGGIVDQVGKFLDDLSNPKSEPGKMFVDIKNAVKDAFGYVKDFFALFGNGDAMKGFANVAGSLVKALPALIALKGIMFLSQTGKSLVNLVAAIAALRGGGGIVGGGGGGAVAAGAGAGKGLFSKLTGVPVVGTVAAILTMSGDTKQMTPEEAARAAIIRKGINPDTGLPYQGAFGAGIMASGKGFQANTNNNITINVQSADPKAVVDALGKYVKGNGKLPAALFPGVKP
jgi:hypothetical protein